MTRGSALVLVWTAVLLLAPRPAVAQGTSAGRVELSGGARWIGPLGFGRADAIESTLGGGTRPLFSTESTLDASVGGVGAISVRMGRAFRVEGSVAYNPTGLSIRVTGDTEVTDGPTVSAPVRQFLVEGGVLHDFRRRGRWSPFAAAGVGYLRQLNDGRTLVETGTSLYGGAGLYYVRESATPRRLKATGARVDARAEFLRGGVAPDRSIRVVPAVTIAFFARF
jgi:hypothetical protein